jgi:hypothetical protein
MKHELNGIVAGIDCVKKYDHLDALL